MTNSNIDESQRTAATVAGFAYLFSFAIVVFAYYGIYTRLIVAGNVAQTARNPMAHERLFRIAIACNLTNLYSLDTPMGIFEIALSFWFLFKGLKPCGIAEPDRAQAGAA